MRADVEPIICRSFTYARRHPLVIGKISGWAPWWGPATPTQYGVGVATALLLLWTKRFWAHLPGALDLGIAIGLPFLLAWTVRSARFEHRNPARALLGLLTLLTMPPGGRLHGRSVRRPRPVHLGGTRIFVSELAHREAPAAVAPAPAVPAPAPVPGLRLTRTLPGAARPEPAAASRARYPAARPPARKGA
jgi:hypothetical protein